MELLLYGILAAYTLAMIGAVIMFYRIGKKARKREEMVDDILRKVKDKINE